MPIKHKYWIKLFLRLAIIALLFCVFPFTYSNQIDSLYARFESKLQQYETNKRQLKFSFIDFRMGEDSLKHYLNLIENKQRMSRLNAAQDIFVLFEKGALEYQLNKRDSAFSDFKKIVKLIDESADPLSYIDFNIAASKACIHFVYDEDAVVFLENIVEMPELISDTKRYFGVLIDLANLYFSQHLYHLSIHYCDLAYPLIENLNDKVHAVDLLILMYRNSYWSNNDSANFEYLNEAHQLAALSDETRYLSQVLYYKGLASRRMGDHAKGVDFLKESRKKLLEAGFEEDIGILIYIAYAYQQLENREQMCYWSDYLLKVVIEQNQKTSLANAYLSKAKCFISLGQKDSARCFIDKALESRALYWNSASSPGYYYSVHEAYKEIGEYELALKYLDLSLSQSRKALQSDNAAKLGQERAKFDYLLQQETIASLQAENELKKEREKRFLILAIAIGFVLLISWIFTFLLRRQNHSLKQSHQNLVKKYLELDKLKATVKKATPKKQNGQLSPNEREMKQIITDLFEIDKIFKETDFSLSVLAGLLNTNTSYLSAIINQEFDMNFKSLVNKYRIDEARKLLTSEAFQNFSMEGIAKESGFHSRSSFYQLFKQETGMSPANFAENYESVLKTRQN